MTKWKECINADMRKEISFIYAKENHNLGKQFTNFKGFSLCAYQANIQPFNCVLSYVN